MSRVDRRTFLKLSGAAGVMLAACDGSALVGEGPRDATTDTGPADATAITDTAADSDVSSAGDTGIDSSAGVDSSVDATADVLDETEVASDTAVLEDTVPLEDTTVAVDSVSLDSGPLDTSTPDASVDPLDPPWDLPENRSIFPIGVQAGDASDNSVLLQTHFFGRGALRVSIRRDDEPDFDRVALALPNAVGAARIQGINLAAGARYRYTFWSSEGRSAIGHFRTALGPGQKRVIRFAGSACTNLGVYPFTPLFRAAEMGLDFYLLAGDSCYCDGARTLDEYRAKWRNQRNTPEYQALFASCNVYATWDDHEVDNDWNPEIVPAAQVEAALSAWEENMPVHARDLDGSKRIWRKQRWGDVLELFVLDCRSERLMSTAFTPNATYISRAQMDWLKAGLSASTARWKIILTSVPITNMPDYFQQERDRWARYPAQRTELLDHIASLGPSARVLFCAGDYHFGTVTHVDRAGGPHINRREVLMGPAGNAANSQWQRAATDDAAMFEFATGTKNTAVFTVDPDSESIRVEWVDGAGNVLGARDIVV